MTTQPIQLPAGTPVTVELRVASKSEYVDATVIGYDGDKVRVKTFNGKTKILAPDMVWSDPENERPDTFEERVEQQKDDLLRRARLSDAAPDLLAALKAIEAQIGHTGSAKDLPLSVLDQMSKAILKAEAE